MRTTMVALAFLSFATAVPAQERTTEAAPAARSEEKAARSEEKAARSEEKAARSEEKEEATPRPAIRVLQDPREISSFYRSGESPLGPWAGLPNDPAYGIADFYRSHQGGYPGPAHGWSQFWTSGYRAPRPAPFRPYRRTIGENGDLFLAVPFLAPVGPISGAFAAY